MDLSLNLRAFVSQRLIKTVDNKRAAAVEILLGTPLVQDMIRRGDVHEIKEVMTKSENIGMQTFDSALYKLAESGRISMDEALKNADSPNNLRLRLNLNGDAPVEKKAEKSPLGLSLIDHDNENKADELDEFDAALLKLVEAGRKTAEQALSEADEPDKLRAQIEALQESRLNQAMDN
jgi:twitching motility protein PilU